LMYLVNTQPDIFYAVSALSHFMCEPHELHLVSLKHILRYLQVIIGCELKYVVTNLLLVMIDEIHCVLSELVFI